MSISDWISDMYSSNLITLLGKGEKATLTRAGLNDALTTFRSTKPHVVFLDYFLGPDVAATGPADSAAKTKARKASIDLLGRLLAEPEIEAPRSEEHTSELQSLMRISYAVFCLKKKKKANTTEAK